jgi:hypothetical protein
LLSPAKLAKIFRTAKIFQTQSLWGSIPPYYNALPLSSMRFGEGQLLSLLCQF